MTLRSRLIITNLFVFAIILIILAVIVYERTRESEIAKLDSRLESFSVEFATEFEDQWEDKEFPESSEIETIAIREWKQIRIELFDSLGHMLYRRGELPPIQDEQHQLILSNHTIFNNIDIKGEWFRLMIRPIEDEEQVGFILAVAVPATDVKERLTDLTGILFISVISALLISTLAVFFFTGRSFRPLDKMVDAAEKISAATLDHRIDLPPVQDEVHRLAVALNAMMRRIEDAFKSQRQFVADASHELRTPLTVIYSELEFLKNRIGDQESSESIDLSIREVDRLTRLVQQLLLLARIDSRRLTMNYQDVRLDELLADSVQLQQRYAVKKNVHISLNIDDAAEVKGDPEHLSRVFMNILDNAVKYSKEGGEVTADLKHDDTTAIITIGDQGPGIQSSETEAVFERFYRSPGNRHEYDGSGLGLAIARELVEAHGGSVRIVDPDATGTTIEITLPIGKPGEI